MEKSGKAKYGYIFVLIITLPILFLLLDSIKSQGTIEKQSEGLLLLCENKNNINIIEEQIAACDGLTLTMKVNGDAIEFKKISQTPSIIGNISNYS